MAGGLIGKLAGDMASDALGLSELCKVITPNNYNKSLSDDFILEETGETIYFLLKSRTDEYCFTNRAIIILDSDSATNGSKTINRYEYSDNRISNISIVTAARIDLTTELLFSINELDIKISVERAYIDEIKDLYKVLVEIDIAQGRAVDTYDCAKKSVDFATKAIGKLAQVNDVLALYKALVEYNDNYIYTRFQESFGFDFK
ncbi:PH domain-containing protein, partial [Paraclostridium bifermentans]|uniref:PH domain-containing protein n=1 Tax=Paraclostridium bifermentans TaxID=1490 RepID=UPI00374ECD7F